MHTTVHTLLLENETKSTISTTIIADNKTLQVENCGDATLHLDI